MRLVCSKCWKIASGSVRLVQKLRLKRQLLIPRYPVLAQHCHREMLSEQTTRAERSVKGEKGTKKTERRKRRKKRRRRRRRSSDVRRIRRIRRIKEARKVIGIVITQTPTLLHLHHLLLRLRHHQAHPHLRPPHHHQLPHQESVDGLETLLACFLESLPGLLLLSSC
jgi:hypothetical protein